MSLLCKCMNSSCPNDHIDGKRNTQPRPPWPLPSPVVYDFLEENVPMVAEGGTCVKSRGICICNDESSCQEESTRICSFGGIGPYTPAYEGPPIALLHALFKDEQPAPVANNQAAVWGMVMKDMVDRDQLGRKRYGVPLQPHNGRDSLRDAYEEALDLVVYLRQAIYERDSPTNGVLTIPGEIK